VAKLIYGMIMSLDGYTEDEQGQFGWAAPDEGMHTYINELGSTIGVYLYGRRMYETMLYWETAHLEPEQPQVILDWARQWQAAEKIVYSRSLVEPSSARTRIERAFDPGAVRRLKADSRRDLAIAGPELAHHAVRTGLIDEFQLIVLPIIVGGGKRFFPPGVQMELDLIEARRFEGGVVVVRYVPRR
jgi:dihydrofolate reductase